MNMNDSCCCRLWYNQCAAGSAACMQVSVEARVFHLASWILQELEHNRSDNNDDDHDANSNNNSSSNKKKDPHHLLAQYFLEQ